MFRDIYSSLPVEQERTQRRKNKERLAALEASSRDRRCRLAQAKSARQNEEVRNG